jgi:hypothetical protein
MIQDRMNSWVNISDGLPIRSKLILCLGTHGGYLYAGLSGPGGYGLWRRPLSEIVSVKRQALDIPSAVSLGKVFPNPTSGSATVTFAVPAKSHVSIYVSDILGRRVKTLLDDDREAGEHIVNWDRDGLSRGLYFYTLICGSASITRSCRIE